MPSNEQVSTRQHIKPLTIEECREIMGWHDKPEHEVEEFLQSVQLWVGGFLDDYFRKQDL